MSKASDNPFPSLLFAETAVPSSPAAGKQRLFVDPADHLLKSVDSTGAVTVQGGGLDAAGVLTLIGAALVEGTGITITDNLDGTWTFDATGGGGGGATTLDGLTDVVLTSPAGGQVIWYDGVEWVNHYLFLDNLFDVNIPGGQADGDVVTWDDTAGQWVAAAPTGGGGGGGTAAGTTFTPTGAISATDVQAALAELDTEKQPLDSDLTAIAALTTTTYGRALLALANQAALMGLLSASSTTAQGIVELATTTEATTGTDAVRAVTPAGLKAAIDKQPEVLQVAVSDEATAITTGVAKVTFRMPYAMTVTAVRASLSTASTSGNPAVDVSDGGASIFSTTLTVDATEKTSVTAATAAVISGGSHAFADDAEVTIDIDTAGTGAKGLKVTLIGTRT